MAKRCGQARLVSLATLLLLPFALGELQERVEEGDLGFGRSMSEGCVDGITSGVLTPTLERLAQHILYIARKYAIKFSLLDGPIITDDQK